MALPQEPRDSQGEENRKSGPDQDDGEYDPSAEALIGDIDDERTLEEEEALGANNAAAVQDELDDLRRESEMPIEELLAYYERMRNEATQGGGGDSGDGDRDDEEQQQGEEEEEEEEEVEEAMEEEEDDEEEDGDYVYGAVDCDESSSDDDDGVNRHWQRHIHVGPEHQAQVPDGLSEYENDLPPYENQDTLIWKCDPNLTKEMIIDYLKRASALSKPKNDISISPASVPKITNDCARLYQEKTTEIPVSYKKGTKPFGSPPDHEVPLVKVITNVYMLQSRKRVKIDDDLRKEIAEAEGNNDYSNWYGPEENTTSTDTTSRAELSTDEYFQDEEQLLFLLQQCNHNIEEALRRRKLDPHKYYLSEPMSLWSQEECLGFEHGLRLYGKNFRAIRLQKVPTRTNAEVITFYYLWKKSERHDVYINNYKLDRKRCQSHPGTTDYMDKFIEDNESNSEATSTTTPTPTTDNNAVNINTNSTSANMNLNINLAGNNLTSSVQPTPPPSTDTIKSSIQYLSPEASSTTITTNSATPEAPSLAAPAPTSQRPPIPHLHVQPQKQQPETCLDDK